MVKLKTKEEIEIMKEGGRKLREVVKELLPQIKAGMTTKQIDNNAEELIIKMGGEPSFKKVKGYQWSTCLSVNEQIVHSPPAKRVLREGDILTVDIGIFYKGLHTDYADTIAVGKVAEKVDPKFALTWVTIELLRFLNYNKKKLNEVDLKVEHFVALLKLVKEGKITELQGKQMLNKFYPKSFMPENIEGKITDKKELERIINAVIGKNKKAVSDFKAGEKSALNFLMGEVMRESEKRADFKIAREVLEKILKEK